MNGKDWAKKCLGHSRRIQTASGHRVYDWICAATKVYPGKWFSQEEMAFDMGISIITVKRAIKHLCQIRAIKKIANKKLINNSAGGKLRRDFNMYEPLPWISMGMPATPVIEYLDDPTFGFDVDEIRPG